MSPLGQFNMMSKITPKIYSSSITLSNPVMTATEVNIQQRHMDEIFSKALEGIQRKWIDQLTQPVIIIDGEEWQIIKPVWFLGYTLYHVPCESTLFVMFSGEAVTFCGKCKKEAPEELIVTLKMLE